MTTPYFFRHDYNARTDEKCGMLIARHGFEGYGVFWALVEIMHEHPTGRLRTEFLDGTARMLGIDRKLLRKIIATCTDIGLFTGTSDEVFSDRVLEQRKRIEEIRQKRADAGRKGGQVKGNSQANANQVPGKVEAKSSREEIEKQEEEENNDPGGRKEGEDQVSMAADAAPPVPEVVDEMEAEFRKFVPFAARVLGRKKMFTKEGLKKWRARRRTFSAREIGEAFQNLQREPDRWKIRYNGQRELSWWLDKDDRIREMQNCHEKGGAQLRVIPDFPAQ